MGEIPGLRYISNYLSTAEHDQFLHAVDLQPWLTELSRRVQHYGYRYDYKSRAIDASTRIGPLPPWARLLVDRLLRDGLVDTTFDQAIVNEYQPGQGIARHVDCLPCFEDAIATVSLGSACAMTFSHPAITESCDLYLEPGSVLILQGPARREWRHEISRRKWDRCGAEVIRRARRVSLTFRKVRKAESRHGTTRPGLAD